MNAEWAEIKARKRDARRALAALPLRVKLQKLDAMRERLDQLRERVIQLDTGAQQGNFELERGEAKAGAQSLKGGGRFQSSLRQHRVHRVVRRDRRYDALAHARDRRHEQTLVLGGPARMRRHHVIATCGASYCPVPDTPSGLSAPSIRRRSR